jgi:hypothetical protein
MLVSRFTPVLTRPDGTTDDRDGLYAACRQAEAELRVDVNPVARSDAAG